VKRRIAIAAVSIIAVFASGYGRHWAVLKHRREVVFGGEQLRTTLTAATQATAQRLHGRENAPLGSDRLGAYISGEAVPVAQATAQELKRLLIEPSSYEWRTDVAKSCILNYGVLVTFRSPGRALRVALCFDCGDLGIYNDTGDDVPPLHGGDFVPARKQLAKVVKTIFPDDAEIQAIREW